MCLCQLKQNVHFLRVDLGAQKSAISAEFTCPKKELGQIQEALLKMGWVEDRKIIKNNEKYYFFSKGNYEYVLIDHDNASVWEESFYEK